ncbi:uncharacterized protein (TIGR02678 family) [Scopulibacillus darangshiensis]|uniref:Uncharacterized protein (TIGR02678 family) n=1 Tax=Scopulibacillus darangshiensis TaxID=442528 RepID=A0A4R2P577_9BACL|nr:TIGR02678 family protein [Scopulibacillus darangshiensis]TCP29989.1 uncharacterized protein (TIGR02678 family) [Scopulibacillus darangshiensis]
MERQIFDEKAEEALGLLFENFWILREHDPESYQLVREREKVLNRYVEEKFGFRLIVHRFFIKMEKTPVEPKAWMGIQSFQKPMDYAIFCCALAFLEEKAVEEQFLLSNICEDIHDLYPGELGIDWTNYEHRKSLVRVINVLSEFHLMETIDGETGRFAMDEDQEVLYEVTVYSRYFMRSYPKDLFQYKTISDILEAEWEQNREGERRKRVYRQLMFSPVVYRKSQNDPDFYYIRNMHRRLRDDLESHTPFKLEMFKNAALLTAPERKNVFSLFPSQKAIHDIIMQMACLLREYSREHQPDDFGEIRLTSGEFGEIVSNLKKQFGSGWSKSYRTAPEKTVGKDLLEAMEDWEMLHIEADTGMIVIRPLSGRVTGDYPKDYYKKLEEARANDGSE